MPGLAVARSMDPNARRDQPGLEDLELLERTHGLDTPGGNADNECVGGSGFVVRRLAALAVGVVVLATGLVGGVGGSQEARAVSWPKQQCPTEGQTRTVEPPIAPAALRDTLNKLARGDTLLMAPGVYEVGSLAVYACHADPANRITVRALDPANPPLIRGAVFLNSPDYWTLKDLRVEGTIPGRNTLGISGGKGWVVDGLEIFGAAKTGALANLALTANSNPTPRDFTVTNSCLRDGGTRKSGGGYHNIYLSARGGGNAASGLISRNVIFNHPGGGGIKLGAGGNAGTVGPWNIRVDRNTIVGGGFGVVLNGRVSRESITRNLMGDFVRSAGATYRGRKSAAIYAHMVTGRRNRAANNYVFGADFLLRRTGRAMIKIAKSNRIGPAPTFNSRSCDGFRTSGRAAKFGRFA